jgi:hypothetical protein
MESLDDEDLKCLHQRPETPFCSEVPHSAEKRAKWSDMG